MSTTRLNVTDINRNVASTEQRESNPVIGQTTAQIRTARIAEQKYIIAGMVLAFSGDPATRWMYPDPYQYLTHFPRFVQAFGGTAFAQNTAYCINGYWGAALWLPPGVEPDVYPVIELVEQSVFESEQADVFAVFEQMGHYHPTQPHWYLPLIGIEPTQQGKGYGERINATCTHAVRSRLHPCLSRSLQSSIHFILRTARV